MIVILWLVGRGNRVAASSEVALTETGAVSEPAAEAR